MPRRAFGRDFRVRPFSWNHVFDLKRSWRVSAQAIVRRSYDLGIIDAVTYRQAFKAMSAKGWRSKGEPHEPAFQQPEMFSAALNALGSKVDLTLEALCRDLHFKPATFLEIARNSVESQRPSTLLDYAAAAWLASGFRETVLAKEASSSGISRNPRTLRNCLSATSSPDPTQRSI